MRQLITSYTFNHTAKTITASDFSAMALENIFLIVDVTNNTVIYQANDSTKGGTLASNVLTLTYNTNVVGFADSDHLQILAEKTSDPVSVQNFPATTTVVQPTGSNLHTVIDSGAVTATISGTPNVAVTSSALPTGAATAANQATEIASLASIDTKLTSPLVVSQTTGTNLHTVVDSGSISVSNFPATTTVTQATGTNLHTVIDSGSVTATISGTPNVAVTSSALPTGASTETTLSSINVKTPPLGQTTMASSTPVVIASDQSTVNTMSPDLYVTGQSAQTALVNNILTTTSGTAATDLLGYHQAQVQVVSTGTAGAFIFEGSNDNVNFQTIPVYNQLILTGTPITAAITATASQLIYTFPVQCRYVRLRISTAITGGSIQAFSKFSQSAWFPAVVQTAQNTAGSLQTTATISSGTVTTVSTVSSVTSGNMAIPGIITDVASAAITTTTTTATLTPTFGSTYQVNIPVTVVSGTTPTLDVEIQESPDSGTNWYAVYDFPRITATGSYNSPVLNFTGNRVRYVQTVSGTTPSFTRAINRLQMSNPQANFYRQLIDRTIVLTTLNSTTATLFAQGGKSAQLIINIGAATTPPTLQLQGSDDYGATWYSVGTTLAGVANSTVQLTIANVSSQFYRAIVSSAGSAVTAGYVLVRSY